MSCAHWRDGDCCDGSEETAQSQPARPASEGTRHQGRSGAHTTHLTHKQTRAWQWGCKLRDEEGGRGEVSRGEMARRDALSAMLPHCALSADTTTACACMHTSEMHSLTPLLCTLLRRTRSYAAANWYKADSKRDVGIAPERAHKQER